MNISWKMFLWRIVQVLLINLFWILLFLTAGRLFGEKGVIIVMIIVLVLLYGILKL